MLVSGCAAWAPCRRPPDDQQERGQHDDASHGDDPWLWGAGANKMGAAAPRGGQPQSYGRSAGRVDGGATHCHRRRRARHTSAMDIQPQLRSLP